MMTAGCSAAARRTASRAGAGHAVRGSRGSTAACRATSSSDGSSSQTSTSGPSPSGCQRLVARARSSRRQREAERGAVALARSRPRSARRAARRCCGEIARPSPVPPFCRESEASTCWKRSKMRLQLVGRDAAALVGDAELDVAADARARRQRHARRPAART